MVEGLGMEKGLCFSQGIQTSRIQKRRKDSTKGRRAMLAQRQWWSHTWAGVGLKGTHSKVSRDKDNCQGSTRLYCPAAKELPCLAQSAPCRQFGVLLQEEQKWD